MVYYGYARFDVQEIFEKFNWFMGEHEDEITDFESSMRVAHEFMDEYGDALLSKGDPNTPSAVYDYLDLALSAESEKEQLEYVRMAREMAPENLDAACLEIELTKKHIDEHIVALQTLIEKGNQQMEAAGYFENDMGQFWQVVETRPYMRVRYAYFHLLLKNGMMRNARAEGESMLRLCESDFFCVRYPLMHIYTYMENEMAALDLHKKYNNSDEVQMLFPMTVLYYKLGDFQCAETYLQRLCKACTDTKKFFSAVVNDKLHDYIAQIDPDEFNDNGINDLLHDYYTNQFLYARLSGFFKWACHT